MIFLLLLILLIPQISLGAISCTDANSVGTFHAVPSDPETISYTTPAGSNQILFVGVGHRVSGGVRTHTQTHAGNALSIVPGTSEQYTDPAGGALYYIVNPTSGTNNVVVDWNVAPLADGIIIWTCSGVDTTDPFRSAGNGTGTGTTASSTPATGQTGDMMVDFAFKDNSAGFTVNGSQTAIQNGNDTSESAAYSSWKAYAGSTTMSATLTSEQWAHISAVLKPSATRISISPTIFR